jgi:hypothetical protein
MEFPMRTLRFVAFLVSLVFVVSAADATSVTIADPVNGGSYTLDVVLKSGTTNTYTVTLTADISAASPLLNGAEYIEQAEFKIADGGSLITDTYSSVSFLSGPSGATWTSVYGPLSNNGCGGNSYGFVCIDASGGASSIDGGITIGSSTLFQWTTEVTLASGVTLDAASSWHIGVHYTDASLQCSGPPTNRTCNQQNAGIVSLTGGTPPVPEPSAAVVFGLGSLMLGAALRKKLS